MLSRPECFSRHLSSDLPTASPAGTSLPTKAEVDPIGTVVTGVPHGEEVSSGPCPMSVVSSFHTFLALAVWWRLWRATSPRLAESFCAIAGEARLIANKETNAMLRMADLNHWQLNAKGG